MPSLAGTPVWHKYKISASLEFNTLVRLKFNTLLKIISTL